jgi:hypothetical protein
MRYAAIISLQFAIHELHNGSILPAEKKYGKSIGIVYGDSEKECRDKIEEIIKLNNLRTMEEK